MIQGMPLVCVPAMTQQLFLAFSALNLLAWNDFLSRKKCYDMRVGCKAKAPVHNYIIFYTWNSCKCTAVSTKLTLDKTDLNWNSRSIFRWNLIVSIILKLQQFTGLRNDLPQRGSSIQFGVWACSCMCVSDEELSSTREITVLPWCGFILFNWEAVQWKSLYSLCSVVWPVQGLLAE